jgi:hypothetical protein
MKLFFQRFNADVVILDNDTITRPFAIDLLNLRVLKRMVTNIMHSSRLSQFISSLLIRGTLAEWLVETSRKNLGDFK